MLSPNLQQFIQACDQITHKDHALRAFVNVILRNGETRKLSYSPNSDFIPGTDLINHLAMENLPFPITELLLYQSLQISPEELPVGHGDGWYLIQASQFGTVIHIPSPEYSDWKEYSFSIPEFHLPVIQKAVDRLTTNLEGTLHILLHSIEHVSIFQSTHGHWLSSLHFPTPTIQPLKDRDNPDLRKALKSLLLEEPLKEGHTLTVVRTPESIHLLHSDRQEETQVAELGYLPHLHSLSPWCVWQEEPELCWMPLSEFNAHI